MFSHPVTLTADKRDGGLVVTFVDIPEAITQGETEEEAMKMAREALETALEVYFDEGRAVPPPSCVKRGRRGIELPVSLSAKILMLNEMIHQKVRPAELARRLQTTPQEVNRLTSIHHTSRIDGIAAALRRWAKPSRSGQSEVCA